MLEALPSWQSSRKFKRVRAIYKSEPGMLERETMGIIQNKTIRAFSPKEVEFLVQNTMRTQDLKPEENYVFVAIDPNGGEPVGAVLDGFKGCAESGTIIGLESYLLKSEDYKMALLGHLMELRKIPTFKRSEFVFIIENNLAFEAHHIVRFIQSSTLIIT